MSFSTFDIRSDRDDSKSRCLITSLPTNTNATTDKHRGITKIVSKNEAIMKITLKTIGTKTKGKYFFIMKILPEGVYYV